MRIPFDKELKEIIRQAMQDRAPVMYRRLMMAGVLESALDERVMLAREIYEEASSIALSGPSEPEYMDEVRRIEAAKRTALESAIAVATEFSDEEISAADQTEP